jgi:cyclic-di-GMP-binding biofilm dispersal mediator protein
MAAYSASKAALTAFDRASGRELRREGIRVIDVRPPHLDTGLETRPIAGEPPRLPPGRDAAHWARMVADAIEEPGRTEVGSGA